jgi:transposase
LIGRTKGGLNTKLHAVTDAKGRPLKFFMTAGQVSDYTGAAALLGSLPAAEWMIADRGYDADWFRDALKDKGIRPCIPGRKSRGKAVRYDKRRYRRRNRIEIMFRPTERLAQGRNPLRQVSQDLPVRRRPRRNRHVLALTINESGP